MITFGIKFNTKLRALTQLANFNFNSICVFNGNLIGSNESGIFVEGGNLDNNSTILAFFRLFSSDFGLLRNKNIRSITTSGVYKQIAVTTVIDNEENMTYTSPGDAILEQKTTIFNTSHDDQGKYIGIKVANVNGSDFSIDEIGAAIGPTQKVSHHEACIGRSKMILPILGGV